ncbi:MAG: hypothetical protein M0R46_17615 [Candidatus Muirbacterium halophilum]|nr:hypothetical protein [Candidatus Muirbacterium halophilum]
MDFKTLMTELFGFSAPTFYNWKKENRPIISLVNKYFNEENIEEFLETGKIAKYENMDMLNRLFSSYRDSYFQFINNYFTNINNLNDYLLVYYFKYLFFIKNNFRRFEKIKTPFYAAAISFGLEQKEKYTDYEKIAFDKLFLLFDFLDTDRGMWQFFVFALENNLEYFIENININKYLENGKIENNKAFGDGSPLTTQRLDHYYFFHCVNNIHPYCAKEIFP